MKKRTNETFIIKAGVTLIRVMSLVLSEGTCSISDFTIKNEKLGKKP